MASLIFKQKNKNDFFLIKNQKLSNIKIRFEGLVSDMDRELNREIEIKDFNNGYLFTGCVNIINSEINNVSFDLSNSNCEDALNIVSSTGQINEIKVENSISDGIDFDFSDIEIDKVISKQSGNDCLDVSEGTYVINQIIVEKCGDKGVSIGEGSKVNINYLEGKYMNILLASKDSSISKVNNIYGRYADVCVSAYNKKQEYFGSSLKVKKLVCSDFIKRISNDNLSKIEINEF